MRLHRFFVFQEELGQVKIHLSEENLLHQWKGVFRLSSGDSVILFDGSSFDYVYKFDLLTKKEADLVLVEKIKNDNVPKREVYLFASIVKKDNFEWILEKGTELGVSQFIPVISQRTEKKDLNMERAKKIVIEASEQSGRGNVPTIHNPLSLEKAITNFPIPLLAFHTYGDKKVKEMEGDGRVGIFIGPEGGWSENEVNLFKKYNVPLVKLGNQILRAETAAIAVSALLLLDK